MQEGGQNEYKNIQSKSKHSDLIMVNNFNAPFKFQDLQIC